MDTELPQKCPPLASSITIDTICLPRQAYINGPIQHVMLNDKHRIEKQTDRGQAEFARIVRQRGRHSLPTTTGSIRIEHQLHQAETPACSVEEDLRDGETEGRAQAYVRQGLGDVFDDC